MTSPRPPAGAGDQTTELAGFLAEALAAPLERHGIRVLSIPAPAAPPEEFPADADPALFWTTPGRAIHAGAGAAEIVVGAGPDRFGQVQARAAELWERVRDITHPALDPTPPRLFGGFSFLPGPSGEEWRTFGDATFLLPRMLYTREREHARLTLAVTEEELSRRGPAPLVAEVGVSIARLQRSAADAPGVGKAAYAEFTGPRARSDAHGVGDPGAKAGVAAHRARTEDADRSRAAWAEAVASIQRRIEEGRAEKIVAARSRSVPLPAADLAEILRRLGRESATAARFAFRLGGSVFLGATPERLVGLAGRRVRTEALAGSVAADEPEREARLLASLKEEAEHEYVVRAIADVLEPLCERLTYPSEPRVQRLRHVLHLQTPFDGTLRDSVHILDLVERLHPTPAVGGLPTEEALEWIRREEPGTRGWYASPVGWFDRAGDGEFGVALRSGLLHGDRAHLFAGAGIVRDSDADAEFEETAVKLRTMMEALGVLA